MAFTDTFTDTTGVALESHTPSGGTAWTLQNGSASSILIKNNAAQMQATAACSYTCDNQGSSALYAQAALQQNANGLYSNSYIAIRIQDQNNFIGWRQTTTNVVALTSVIAGTASDLVTGTATIGDIYKVNAPTAGNSTIQFFDNGVQQGTDQTVSSFTSITNAGICTADSRTNQLFDNFEAGANAAASGTTIVQLAGGGGLAGPSGLAGPGGLAG